MHSTLAKQRECACVCLSHLPHAQQMQMCTGCISPSTFQCSSISLSEQAGCLTEMGIHICIVGYKLLYACMSYTPDVS